MDRVGERAVGAWRWHDRHQRRLQRKSRSRSRYRLKWRARRVLRARSFQRGALLWRVAARRVVRDLQQNIVRDGDVAARRYVKRVMLRCYAMIWQRAAAIAMSLSQSSCVHMLPRCFSAVEYATRRAGNEWQAMRAEAAKPWRRAMPRYA